MAIDYRLLPRVPISEALEDCIDGFVHLLEAGHHPSEIVIAGDSAGGFLALMTAISVVERGLGTPGGVVCLSPYLDLGPRERQRRDDLALDPLFPASALNALIGKIDEVALRHAVDGVVAPIGAPLHEDTDLSLLPPVLIQCGARELLALDSYGLAERLRLAGVEHYLQIWDGQCHVFQAAADLIPESREAIDEMGRFVRSLTDRSGIDVATVSQVPA